MKVPKAKPSKIKLQEITSANTSNLDHSIDLKTLFRLFLLPASFESVPPEAKDFVKAGNTIMEEFTIENNDMHKSEFLNEEEFNNYEIDLGNDQTEIFNGTPNQNLNLEMKKVNKTKTIPIIRLKKFIEEKVSLYDKRKSIKSSGSMDIENGNKGLKFSELLNQNSDFGDKDISIQTWFVTLLHLSNEKEYNLLSNSLGDFTILNN